MPAAASDRPWPADWPPAGSAGARLPHQRKGRPSTAAEITAPGSTALAIGADLRSAEAPSQLVQAAADAPGPVDVLVSNAGLSHVQPLEDITAAQFDEMLAVNLRAPFLLAQAAAPSMGERGFGRIPFISSVAAFTGGLTGPHYAASKAGLHGLTHFLACRLAASAVTVNAPTPALTTETGMLPADLAQLRQQVPAGRLGQLSEVADLATATLANAYLTNQVISLDGGIHPR